MRKISSVFLGLVFLTITLALQTSCVGTVPASSDIGTAGKAKDQAQPADIKFWHLWPAGVGKNDIVFNSNLKAFSDSHPNIRIHAEAVENEAYKTKIRIAVAANEAPDIFFSWGAGFSKPFIDAGKVLPLDDYLKDGTKERVLEGGLDNFTYNGKVYGLPVSLTAGIFYCNTELFDRYHVKIPDSFPELLEAIKAFKANNIVPMAVGEKDRWPGMFYYDILAIRTAGVKLCTSALNKKSSFRQREFIDAAEKFTELVHAGAFAEDSFSMTRDEAQAEFKRGKVAMYYNGSWIAAELEEKDNPDVKVVGKIAIRNFPLLEGAGGDTNGFLGGAVDGFMVNACTKFKKEAVTAMKYLAENHSIKGFESGVVLPAWKIDDQDWGTSPLIQQMVNLTKGATGYVLAWDTFLVSEEADIHKNLVADLFTGTISPEEFCEKMQKINEVKHQ